MRPEDPTDPQAWLIRAKSNLSYPSWTEEVTQEEYREALELAARVVFWAESVIA